MSLEGVHLQELNTNILIPITYIPGNPHSNKDHSRVQFCNRRLAGLVSALGPRDAQVYNLAQIGISILWRPITL